MFKDFYQFREKPFQLAPNPDFMYKSKKHQNALSYMEYSLMENAGVIVLTGEVGSGKTTTVRYTLKKFGDGFDTAMIANTKVNSGQLLRMVLSEFEITCKKTDKVTLISALNHHFIRQYGNGKRALLVIDEAQNLSSDALEEIRMLLNLQTDQYPLVQILLVGQPELLQTLKKTEMRQFTQRVAAHIHLTALDPVETTAYIVHRLTKAGGRDDLFTTSAMQMIYDLSGGIPRSINLLCQAALVYGFADEASRITQDIIKQISKDKIGVGITSEPEGVSPENTITEGSHDRENTTPSADTLENLRMEIKGHIQQMESVTALRNDLLLKKIKKQLVLEHRRNQMLKLKIDRLEEKILELSRHFDQLSKNQQRPALIRQKGRI